MDDSSSPYLTVGEVARHLRVSTQTVRRWCQEGALPAIQPGRVLRVHRDDVDKFLASSAVQS